jgi:hypothetical protein
MNCRPNLSKARCTRSAPCFTKRMRSISSGWLNESAMIWRGYTLAGLEWSYFGEIV